MTESGALAFTIWLTGASGAGKTTLGLELKRRLELVGRSVHLLDGDEIRASLNRDLGFSEADRSENVRRISWVAELLNQRGIDVIVAVIAPYQQLRDQARMTISTYIEVYMCCSLEVLRSRDVKGLYQLAMQGSIRDFTGVSDVYEPPEKPDVTCYSDGRDSLDSSANMVMRYLVKSGVLLRPQ